MTSPPPPPPGPSLAILHLANQSGDLDRLYFSEGITEVLAGALTGVRALRVASLGSTLPFRGRTPAPAEVLSALGASTVLEGGVRRFGTQIRITLRLTGAAGTPLWSVELDRKLDDLPSALPDLVRQILSALGVEPIAVERPALERPPTVHALAFDAWLRGRHTAGHIRRSSQEFSQQMYGDALSFDPDFALAHAGIADCHALLFSYWDSSREHLDAADAASARAVGLAPDWAETHVSRGAALALLKRYDEGEREFQRALELKPNLFEAHYQYARSCRAAGRFPEAARLFEQASALRPEDYATPSLLASVYSSLSRTEESRAVQRTALRLAEQWLKLNPDDERALYLGAGSLSALGDSGRAREWAKRAVAMEPDDSAVLYNVACVYSQLGLRDSAIDLLEQSVRNGFGHWDWIEHDSDLDPLRADPRFQALRRG